MLVLICGHGAGDPGACGNGYQEADLVRALAQKIAYFGGVEVMIGDMSKNWYKDKLVNNTNIPKGAKVLELHMDSGVVTARGAHVIIDADFEPDKWDIALAEFISGILPGRSQIIVKRNNLANPNRAQAAGINYRLLECGFISNPSDVEIFNSRMDEIAKGILNAFEIEPKEEVKAESTPAPAVPTKSLEDWAREVKAGKHGNGHANREASLKAEGCPFAYSDVRAKVNELCGVKTQTKPVSNYYPKYTGKSYGIDTVFRAIGVPEVYCGNWKNRKPVAAANGISKYTGNQTQNTKLVSLAKQGKLKKA